MIPFLITGCQDPGILRIIYFIKKIIEIAFILAPIILIVMMLVDFGKNVISSSSDDMNKTTKISIKRIVYCIIVFFVPAIVNAVMNLAYNTLGLKEENGLTCYYNATVEEIQYYQAIEDSMTSIDNVYKQNKVAKDKTPGYLGGGGTTGGNTNIPSSNAAFGTVKNDGYKAALDTTQQRMSAEFHDTTYHKTHWHRGMDIAAAGGTKILALGSGTVMVAEYNNARGYYVVIDHGNGLATLYQHCSKLNVEKGLKVSKNQVIAFVGNTGESKGNHLHLEVWVPHGQGLDNWGNKNYDVTDPETFDFSKLPS